MRPFGQHILGERGDAVRVAEEMDDVLGPRQQREVALNDDAIETLVYKPEQRRQTACERFPSVVSVDACLSNTIMRETTGGDHLRRSTQTGTFGAPAIS
jgi:hypothetical protein